MGGLLLTAIVILLALLLDAVDASTYAVLLALLGVTLLGAFDDWLNARTGVGISARQKLLWQTGVAIISAIYLQQHFAFNSLVVPFVGEVPIAPILWIVVAVVAIVATSNGVNLTDGLDGLSGGTMTFAWISYMVIALLNAPGQVNLAIVCALIAGALVGFLWFNVHPASVIMGDAGALGFGAALAVTGLVTGHVLLLPLIGIIFVVETGSVILQVASVKLTGKRIFLFTPIHHHFERLGWAETQITFRFWVIGAIGGILGIVTFLATRGQG
jgi:phospho-N-acetylmuramoyl-pentapeptide-transferase